MPVLKTVVEPGIKTLFRHMAKGRGLSESEFLRQVVLMVTGKDIKEEKPIVPVPEKAEPSRLMIRLPLFLLEEAKRRGTSKGMATSRWVAALVQSNLTRSPVMSENELLALRANIRELTAIGRNINQIAKSLNENFYETERVRLDKLEALSRVIAENKAAIRALVRASQNSWEAD